MLSDGFTKIADMAQGFKELMRMPPGWEKLSGSQKEALDMFATDISRILNGEPNARSHWSSIEGYAKIVGFGLAVAKATSTPFQDVAIVPSSEAVQGTRLQNAMRSVDGDK